MSACYGMFVVVFTISNFFNASLSYFDSYIYCLKWFWAALSVTFAVSVFLFCVLSCVGFFFFFIFSGGRGA